MIPEVYVDKEIMPLLLKANCPLERVIKQDFRPVYYTKDFNDEGWQDCDAYYIPTQAQVMKWLREVHNIVIEINMEDYMTSKNGKLQVWYSYTIWTFIRHLGETGLVDSRYDDRAFWQENVKVGQSYEETCDAAIKYTLENLI